MKQTKKVHPAVSKFYSELGKVGGKKSAEKRLKAIIENSKVAKSKNAK